MSDVAIKVKNLTKQFVLPHQRVTSVKSKVVSLFKKFDAEAQLAVNDVSFEVKKGEFFGIVGRNGSGKSTLLKCMAGVYAPNKGSVHINGKLVPFIELGVGFNPELSGRDNVFLNGALLGFSTKQMEKMYDEIVEFAELEEFMDQKLKNYSSGMQVRLAFSIAIRAKGDILLLDEVLAVGDAAFQQKCNDYFASLKNNKDQTVILVSHNMAAIEKYCVRALLMEQGKTAHIGSSSDVAGMYEDTILKEEAAKDVLGKVVESASGVTALGSVYQGGKKTRTVEAFKDLALEFTIQSPVDIKSVHAALHIRNSEGIIVFAADTMDSLKEFDLTKKKPKKLIFEVDNIFTNGSYACTLVLNGLKQGVREQLVKRRNVAPFTVFGVRRNVAGSVVQPHYKVREG